VLCVDESEEFNRVRRVVDACGLGEIVEVQNRKNALLARMTGKIFRVLACFWFVFSFLKRLLALGLFQGGLF